MADARLKQATVVALIVATVGAAGAVSATETDTIFSRLAQLDGAELTTSNRRDALQARVDDIDAQLDERWDRVDVSLRAARPIRRSVSHGLARWLGGFRAATREAIDNPAAADDTHRLLRYAADDALRASLVDVDVIQRADRERRSFGTLLQRRAQTSIALARTQAVGTMSGEVRDDILSEARANGAAVDLAATDGAMRALLESLTSEPQADFHRQKGTLARPVTSDPDHRFGARATLVRATGLTYRPEAGREVHATGEGDVLHVGSLEGWGSVIVLAHGGGYRSVYGHLGSVAVSKGDHVDRADVIATAGDSGSIDGVRLYYELRKGVEPIDPEPWIMRY